MAEEKKSKEKSTINKKQILNVYSPEVRSRTHKLPVLDMKLMLDAFIPNNELKWKLTSNCKVIKLGTNGFVVRLLRRARPHDRKGVRKSSVIYDKAILAENNAFEFRYLNESKDCQKCLDEYKANLKSLLSKSPAKSTLPIHYPPSSISTISPLKKRIRQCSSATAKGYAMSGSLYLNSKVNRSINPNNCPSNYNDLLDIYQECVIKIQRCRKNRDVRRSAVKMRQTIKNQAYRKNLIDHLSKFLSSNNCELLLLGSEDPEILVSYSPYDRQHATLKTRHITDALSILHDSTANNLPVTWIQCCKHACEKNYNVIQRARTIADWYLQFHETGKLQFKRSEQGRAAYFAKSPFSEDECLSVQLKSWARQDLEHLNVRKTKNYKYKATQ